MAAAGKATDFIIPNSVTAISPCAFAYCITLRKIKIPASVNYIGMAPFMGATNLNTITVDNKNSAYKSSDNMIFTKDGETLVIALSAENVTIPDNVKTVGMYAFLMADIENLTLPNSLKAVPMAFVQCDIQNVYYKGSKKEWNNFIAGNAFDDEYNTNPFAYSNIHYTYGISASISSGKFTIAVDDEYIGKIVILGLYKDGQLTESHHVIYSGSDLVFDTAKNYTEAKIMLWDNLDDMTPLFDVYSVKNK